MATDEEVLANWTFVTFNGHRVPAPYQPPARPVPAVRHAQRAWSRVRRKGHALGGVSGGTPESRETLMDWQPIETAPQDGTLVLVWSPAHGASAARLRGTAWRTLQGVYVRKPTHWMPLPNPPGPLQARVPQSAKGEEPR